MNPIHDRPTNPHNPSNPEQFWDKADRIAVMTAGGAALGSAIGQIPGAVVGGILAALYGFFISFAKTNSA